MSEVIAKSERSPKGSGKKKGRKKSSNSERDSQQSQQQTNSGIFTQSQTEYIEGERLATLYTLNNRLEEVLAARKAGDTIDLTLTTEVYQEHISKLEKKYDKNLKAQLAEAIKERDAARNENAELENRISNLEYNLQAKENEISGLQGETDRLKDLLNQERENNKEMKADMERQIMELRQEITRLESELQTLKLNYESKFFKDNLEKMFKQIQTTTEKESRKINDQCEAYFREEMKKIEAALNEFTTNETKEYNERVSVLTSELTDSRGTIKTLEDEKGNWVLKLNQLQALIDAKDSEIEEIKEKMRQQRNEILRYSLLLQAEESKLANLKDSVPQTVVKQQKTITQTKVEIEEIEDDSPSPSPAPSPVRPAPQQQQQPQPIQQRQPYQQQVQSPDYRQNISPAGPQDQMYMQPMQPMQQYFPQRQMMNPPQNGMYRSPAPQGYHPQQQMGYQQQQQGYHPQQRQMFNPRAPGGPPMRPQYAQQPYRASPASPTQANIPLIDDDDDEYASRMAQRRQPPMQRRVIQPRQ